MVNYKKVEKENRDLVAQAARLLREREEARRALESLKPVKPMFFTKLFNEMDANTKSLLLNECGPEIGEVFVAMDMNLKETDPNRWLILKNKLVDRLEDFVKTTSGKTWTIKLKGTVAGSLDFKLHSNANKHKDYIDIVWSHLGYKKPRHNAKDLTQEERIQESPTPEPVPVKMHTRIFRRDF